MVDWKEPKNISDITKDETHVWLLPLELKSNQLTKLKTFLSDEDRSRAERFHFDKQRNHYIAARGQTRKILKGYIDSRDEGFVFSYNEFGKPFIENKPIHFNISHSHNLALLAINLKFELGVDIEWMHRKTKFMDIGERFFSPKEFLELRSLPEKFRRQGFYNCWTRKESYIKARGKGLGIPLSRFEVSLKPDDPVLLKSTPHDPEALKQWTLYAFEPHPDYAAALTINTNHTRLFFWDASMI